jgi:gamma-glutamyl:cysteine ligase YbdK (ATP-grasp superfamily)
MSLPAALPAFSAYGVELEYMIVDRETLSVAPLADRLLRGADGRVVNELERGAMAWSNELTLHLIEVKNSVPDPDLAGLADAFQAEAVELDRRLAPLGACLMPGGAHPWMDPLTETRLWPHAQAEIYRTYDRIFDCRRHGFANLQSMHLNLPFADDAEFARLHAAARLLLPILPALAASSPLAGGRPAGALDGRMAAYCGHQARLPASIGGVIPDTAASRTRYEAEVLAPIYAELAPHDPDGVLRHEWLNARGAIPRFDRIALEIRVIDAQECPRADLAIAALTVTVLKSLYEERWGDLAAQRAIGTASLERILRACIRDADRAVIDDAAYLQLLDYPAARCQAGALWGHLVDSGFRVIPQPWREPLNILREEGPLARRILRAVGPDCERPRVEAVYRALCDCLAEGHVFMGLD